LLAEVTDLEFWQRVVTAYIAAGWNKRNITAMLDYYERQELPTTSRPRGHSGPGRDMPPPATALLDAIAGQCGAVRPGPEPPNLRPVCQLEAEHAGPHQGQYRGTLVTWED
jgi:hypothetical protein